MDSLRGSRKYLDEFVDGLRFFVKLNKAYRKFEPDYSEIKDRVSCNWIGERRLNYNKFLEKFLQPMAESYLIPFNSPDEIANRCHALSQGFFVSWKRMGMDDKFPLAITVGNVFYKNESIYNVSKTSLKRILNEGKRFDRTLNVHVWLTLDDMTVVDLSILSTLIVREKLVRPKDGSLALIWRGDDPGDIRFEPLLIDNEFVEKVDEGQFVPPISD